MSSTLLLSPAALPRLAITGAARWRAAAIVLAAGLCAVAHLLATTEAHRAVAYCLYFVAPGLGLAWAIQGLRPTMDRRTASVACLAGGIVANLIADLCWVSEQRLADPPFPAISDLFYLTSLPLFMAGVLLLPTRPLSGLLRGRIVIDGLVGITSLAAFSWCFYLGPILLEGESTHFARLVAAAYPLFDLLLLSSLWLLGSHAGHPALRQAITYLGAGVIFLVIGDSYYGVAVLYDQYNPAFDGVFALAIGFLGLGAHAVGTGEAVAPGRALPPASLTSQHVFLPYTSLAPLTVLLAHIIWSAEGDPFATGVLLAVLVCVGLLLLRQVLVLRENLRLNNELSHAVQQLQSLAATDALTALPNRRVFVAVLQDQLAQKNLPLSLLMLDVDHFKSFNDDFGHPAGDDLLVDLAAVLRHHLPTGGLAARYGGEEFAMVLPEMGCREAERIATVIRCAIEHHPFPHRHVTVSIGLATVETAMTGVDSLHLIETADRALYEAKRLGRNRVARQRVGLPRRRRADGVEATLTPQT